MLSSLHDGLDNFKNWRTGEAGHESHEVFMSFRGMDARSFTRSLYEALKTKGIKTFLGDGDMLLKEDIDAIGTIIPKEIAASKVSIIIFSENYVSSDWCLDELEQIVESYKHSKDRRVIPVFYKVNRADIQQRLGSLCLQKWMDISDFEVRIWQKALTEVASITGFHYTADGYEYETIVKILEETSAAINGTSKNFAGAAGELTESDIKKNREKLDVFLSFRGTDIPAGFARNLFKALRNKGIETFFDDNVLKEGDTLTDTLAEAIAASDISIIIFSENYLSSRWCLSQLEMVLECKGLKDQRVIPVFYKVRPADIRHQLLSFSLKIWMERRDAKFLLRHKALIEVVALSGFCCTNGHEHEKIAKMVLNEASSSLVHEIWERGKKSHSSPMIGKHKLRNEFSYGLPNTTAGSYFSHYLEFETLDSPYTELGSSSTNLPLNSELPVTTLAPSSTDLPLNSELLRAKNPKGGQSEIKRNGQRYDVFLSFRGHDHARSGFAHYMYEALREKEIKTLFDPENLIKDQIANTLLEAIEASFISIVLLSEGYVSSTKFRKWRTGEDPAVENEKDREGHDVFLSFRGKDTRTGLARYLYEALVSRGIKTFFDDKTLNKGAKISKELLEAIEGSDMSIVLFSENYVTSHWCLEELEKIIECKSSNGQLVIPVFFKVDPADIRHQRGSFSLQTLIDRNNVNVPIWKKALTEVASLSGFHYTNGYEFQTIKKIVEEAYEFMEQKKVKSLERFVSKWPPDGEDDIVIYVTESPEHKDFKNCQEILESLSKLELKPFQQRDVKVYKKELKKLMNKTLFSFSRTPPIITPQLFVEGKYVGGYDEAKRFLKEQWFCDALRRVANT